MDQDNLVGQTLGKYEIQAEIGRGGMGLVYRGYDPLLERQVAIKLLPSHLAWQKEFVERFMREARTAARLRHPSIVTIHDVGQEGDNYYFVMEYLEGQPLTELIQQRGSLPPATVYSMLRPLAAALEYAHRKGLIHRDIKPANVIVSPTNQVTLTDFGIARAAQESRLTATGAIVGTPEYMSPEQAKGEEVNARTDQYSLAVVAYEMLSGEVPFQAESTMALLYKITQEPPPPICQVRPDLPEAVEGVFNKALAKEPGNRYKTPTAFVEALGRALTERPALVPTQAAAPPTQVASRRAKATPPPPSSAPPVAAGRRVPGWVWGLGGLLVLALIGGGWLLFGGGSGSKATPTPEVVAAATETATPTATPTSTSTFTPTPTGTPDQEATRAAGTLFAVATTSAAPTPTSTRRPTRAPTRTPTRTPRPTRTRTPTPAATRTRTATPRPRPSATSPPATSGALFDFEQMGTWRRGDQPYGELTQSRERVHTGNYAARLRYDFPATDQDFVVFLRSLSLSGQPNTVGAWVYGDGSSHFLNVWVQDAAGEIWSVHLGRVGGTGWRQMVGTLAPDVAWPGGHVSGPDNGVVDYPVRFYALVLDRPGSGPQSGQIYVDDVSVWRGQAGAGATATPVAGAPTPTPGGAAPPSGEIGRIVFTVKADDAYYLYSTDPAWSQMVEIGRTDWARSTCGGGATASTLEGFSVSLYGVNKCGLSDSVDVCLSPDGQYKVVTDRVNGGHTVALWRASDNAVLEGYYHGPLNKAAGIEWSPDSRSFLFTIVRNVHVARVGSAGYSQIIPEIDDAWPPQFSPDSSLVYYLKPVGSVGASDVFVVGVDGSNPRNLTNAPSTHKLCPRWRP